MKKLSIILVLIIISSAAGYYFLSSKNPDQRGRPNSLVEVIQAERQTLFDNVEVLGSSYANESVEITSNITETISEIKFTDGQAVSKGDVIAVLEQSEEKAQLKAAQLQSKEHDRELNRLKRLLANKAASKRDYDERKTMRDITLQQAEEVKARIKDRTLQAPFDGILGIRSISSGALVRPGDVITTIQDISKIKLDFNVPSIHLSKLKPGTPINAYSDSLRNMKFEGVIETINNRVDPVTRSILVRAIIDNPDSIIKPGILMKVTLLQNQREGMVVPEESVVQEGDKHYLMIVSDDNTVRKRQVETGIHKEGLVEIVDNLNESEQVIVRGVHKVRNGSKVMISKVWDSIRSPEPGIMGEN